MGALVGAAAIGLAGTAIGSWFGSRNTKAVNETNRQIAQQTNAQNQAMFEQQLGYNTEMWEKTNEYNSPENQRKRYQLAGLNPYMMMDSGSNGNADLVSTPSPNPAVTGAPMQADNAGIQAFAQMLGTSLNGAADFVAKSIDNTTRSEKNAAEIAKQYYSGKLDKAQAISSLDANERAQQLQSLIMDEKRSQIGLSNAATKEALERVQLLTTETLLKKYCLENISPAQLREINSRIDYYAGQIANGRISAEAAATSALAQMKQANLAIRSFDETKDALIGELQSRARLHDSDAELNRYNAQPEWDIEEEIGHWPYTQKRKGKMRAPAKIGLEFFTH